MRIGAAITGDLRTMMKAELKNIGDAARKSIAESTAGLKEELRAEVRSAGMGNRLATTWRSKLYPNEGPLDSAGFVYSKAPKIIDAHSRGVTIRARGGKYLAIPTDAAPKKGTDGKRVTPKTMPSRFGELRFVPRAGKPPLLVADNLRVSTGKKGGFLRASATAQRTGRGVATVVMFILVPQVKLKKKFDIKSTSEKWLGRMHQKLSSELGKS